MLLKKMKASLAVALVMSMSLLTACGGSAEKKADTTEKSGETQAANRNQCRVWKRLPDCYADGGRQDQCRWRSKGQKVRA